MDTAEEALQVSGLDPQLQALKGAGPTKRGALKGFLTRVRLGRQGSFKGGYKGYSKGSERVLYFWGTRGAF